MIKIACRSEDSDKAVEGYVPLKTVSYNAEHARTCLKEVRRQITPNDVSSSSLESGCTCGGEASEGYVG